MDFAWYTEINHSNEVEQGDLIPNCPIVIPPSKIEVGDEPEIEIEMIDSIVLSQSCDLVNNKIQIVLVCPYFPLSTFVNNIPDLPEKEASRKKVIKKHIDNLKKGYLPGYHLLNKIENNKEEDYIVVDFRNVYGIQIDNLKEIAERLNSRQRLLPPYREHLSQSFSRFFMRVGLPQDIVIEGYW